MRTLTAAWIVTARDNIRITCFMKASLLLDNVILDYPPDFRGISMIRIWTLLVLLALPALPQGGESTQILGNVQDSSGALIPGVEVTATHLATGQSRKVTTGESGTYVFPLITPGDYV